MTAPGLSFLRGCIVMRRLNGSDQRHGCIKGLSSGAPDPAFSNELMLFGQFVGDWDIVECLTLNEEGKWTKSSGELHWGWILDGRALQDVWMTTDPVIWDKGTTIRFFDKEKGQWQSIWVSPGQGAVRKFEGTKIGEEIVLKTTDQESVIMKWVFYDIRRNSFGWRSEKSSDQGRTWKINEKMKIIRQEPSSSEL